MNGLRIDDSVFHKRSHMSAQRTKRRRELVYAVIHQVPARTTPGMLSIRGMPLIARQIEWLLSMGCEGIVVEVSDDEESAAIARYVRDIYGVDFCVRLVTTGSTRPLGTREVARRAGIASHRPVLAVPADLLGDGDLTRMVPVPNAFGVVAFFEAPKSLARTISGGTVRLVRESLAATDDAPAGQPTPLRGPGWAVRVSSAKDAAAITNAAWRGEVPGIGDAHALTHDVARVA